MTRPYCSRCQRAMYLPPDERLCSDCLAYEESVREHDGERLELAEAERSATPTGHGGQARARVEPDGPEPWADVALEKLADADGALRYAAAYVRVARSEAAALRRRLAWREAQVRALLHRAQVAPDWSEARGMRPARQGMTAPTARRLVEELTRLLAHDAPSSDWEPEGS